MNLRQKLTTAATACLALGSGDLVLLNLAVAARPTPAVAPPAAPAPERRALVAELPPTPAAPQPVPVVAVEVTPPPDPVQVFFRTDDFALSPSALKALEDVAGAASVQSGLRLVVRGHTDARGKPKWNAWLSHLRAQAVTDELSRLGVTAERLQMEAVGPARPAEEGSGKQVWARNRRVEVTFEQRVP